MRRNRGGERVEVMSLGSCLEGKSHLSIHIWMMHPCITPFIMHHTIHPSYHNSSIISAFQSIKFVWKKNTEFSLFMYSMTFCIYLQVSVFLNWYYQTVIKIGENSLFILEFIHHCFHWQFCNLTGCHDQTIIVFVAVKTYYHTSKFPPFDCYVSFFKSGSIY